MDVDGYRMSMESGWLIRPAEYPHGCRWGVREQSTCRSHWPLQDQTSITTAASSAYDYYLVGGFNPSEKYKSVDVSWDYYSQYMQNKICSKPPTSYHSNILSLSSFLSLLYSTPCVAQTWTLRMSCYRTYDRRDCRKYGVYAVFSGLGFKVFRA